MLAVYVTLMVSEGNNSLFEVLPWALVMALGAVLAFASAHAEDPRLARNLLVAATALFGVLGVLSLFSIGLGFLLAAAAAAVGLVRFPSGESRR
jgi:hypothetical protein